MTQLSLTVYFDDQMWVGVVEEQEADELRVARHIFGAEPGPGEVLAFVLHEMLPLLRRSGGHETAPLRLQRIPNPKRAAREAARASAACGISTQAQEAMRREIERHKVERKAETKQEREAEIARRRAIADQRRRERHRGH